MNEKAKKSHPATGTGAVLFTGAGFAAAFGLASCCAIPLLLYALGIGAAAWLTQIGIVSLQYREWLTGIAAVGLGVGGFMLWQQWRSKSCASGLCARPSVKVLTTVALLAGLALLYFGYTVV